jgi:hypothetical protein
MDVLTTTDPLVAIYKMDRASGMYRFFDQSEVDTFATAT